MLFFEVTLVAHKITFIDEYQKNKQKGKIKQYKIMSKICHNNIKQCRTS